MWTKFEQNLVNNIWTRFSEQNLVNKIWAEIFFAQN